MALSAGTKLGRYEIRSQLGAGGMGEVYLARDTKLDRAVALKILPAQVGSDNQRMRRFIQEAKAASALNHPNIITIHEVEQIDSTHFIATEFIDGETLRRHLSATSARLTELLDIAIQIASALAAAHEAGIAHRDIKPENIMVRRDGYVKVLDFGLAKLTERETVETDAEAPTRAMINTGPGVVMGTVGYMSPEQARGVQVDARTDIWSLGVVLYEMVTGRAPFEGSTPSDVIAKILEREPPPLARYTRDAPESLEWIVSKALSRDREERYQTAREILADLKKLRRRLEFDAEIERSAPPESDAALPSSTASLTGANKITEAVSTATDGARPTTSAEYIVTGIKRHKRAVALALAAVALSGALLFAWYKYSNNSGTPQPAGEMKITRLISGISGQPGSLTISPDGKYVVYAISEAGKSSLWVRQVSQNTSIQIVPPIEGARTSGTTFSQDGELIYFVRRDPTNTLGALYQVPVLGGREPKKLIDHITGPISLSPDGQRFVFTRQYHSLAESAIMVANIDGSGEARKLATRSGDDWFAYVTWSPDGKRIACAANSVKGGLSSTIVEIPAEGGPEKPLTSHKWNGEMHRLLWLSDGSGLILSVGERPNYQAQIWQVSYPKGEARRVTNDLNSYGTWSLGVTSDSSTIATLLEDSSSKIWVAGPNEDESSAAKLTNGKYDGEEGLALLPGGRIIYVTRAGDSHDIWVMNADGTGNKPLTSDAFSDSAPVVSPDGRYIIFASERPDHLPHIWRMDTDGGNPKQLTTAEDFEPTLSPDGRWVVFASFRKGPATLWKVSIDGGEAVQVSDKVATSPFFSPDGKLISCGYYDESVSPPRWRPAIISFEDGRVVRVLDFPNTAERPLWSPDGREFIYVDTQGGVSNIWSQPVAGGPARQLTKFSSDLTPHFIITPDGKRFIITRRTISNDIVLIKDFR